MDNNNQHIEEFLKYYYTFDKDPGYAVLLKGKWGVGKTWFVNKTLQSLTDDGGKHLYVSLYGVGSYEEIENEFFKQLHPALSSKSMALTTKIAKGLLKASLKIDFDGDKSPDADISIQIPNINIPKYLTNTSGFIIIFDDLERCSISIENILGYINHLVEHQGYKVIIIANEEEILEKQKDKEENELSYRRIKEKLVGKTFEISPDLNEALNSFILDISCQKVKDICLKNENLIKELYISSEYKNLRHLKQALWDFERLYNHFSDKVMQKDELVQHLLKLYLIFSFEIKSGSILPVDIKSFRSSYFKSLIDREKEDKTESAYQKISKKYLNINFNELLLEDADWEDIFDKGIIDSSLINNALLKSGYFLTDSSPDWVKLWHIFDLSDEDFTHFLNSVMLEYEKMIYDDIGIVKHITGIFLRLSEIQLISKNKNEILDAAKKYVDALKSKGKLLPSDPQHYRFRENESWGGLFHAAELEEFKIFCAYVDLKRDEAIIESYPEAGSELISHMKNNPDLFYRRITLRNHQDNLYYNVPILNYIPPEKFVDVFGCEYIS
jgi:hypothetical protein